MPYHIEKNGDQFDVLDDSGKVVGQQPTRKKATEQLRALYANVPEAKDKEIEAEPVAPAPVSAPNLIERLKAALHGPRFSGESRYDQVINNLGLDIEEEDHLINALKEGRRNRGDDASRLQQIHDLSVANGADCMFSVKEVNGQYRWILFSSNSFQDSDRQIVAQAALEADVARTDKAAGGNYGPLRYWHMGQPDPVRRIPGAGVDIGLCDFRAMQGRMLIESGTINDPRIGLALKNKANDLAASIGFFHPLTEPDGEGVFHTIQVFERSVLPRAKASNQLTALTVTGKGDQDNMATMKDKWDEFVTMLGGDKDMALSVVKQAQETEAQAAAAGITAKAKADEPKKKGDEGSAEEEGSEPKDEAATEGDEPITPKNFGKKAMPFVKKEIDEAIALSLKGMTEKEAGLEAQIVKLEAALKETQGVIQTLAGDLPRGVRAGFRASTAETTVTMKAAANEPKADPLGDMYSWMTSSLGSKPQ